MAVFDLTDGTNSRIESSLTGAEGKFSAPVSRLERIINGEDIKPLSRIEEVMTDYVKHGGGGIESACALDTGSRRFMGPFYEDETGIVASETVYDPRNWLQTWGRQDNMPANIDGNGKWHVHGVNNGSNDIGNGGFYNMAIDPKKVESVYYHVTVDGDHSFSPGTNADGYKTCMAITNRIAVASTDYYTNPATVDAIRENRSYQDGQGTWHFTTGFQGTLHISLIPNVEQYPVLWLCYNSWGLDMTFEEIRFNLKEE